MGSGALSAGPPAPPTPHKKMKKRKELNALIGLAGDGGRKKSKKGSGHRLLRTEPPDSESESDSEESEYTRLEGRRLGLERSTFIQCCKVCYPLCGFVVLTACVVTCVGLVWMQVALKENMDALKETFRAMEAEQKTSLQKIPQLSEDLLTKQKQLDELESGEIGLNKLWTNITEINKQIAALTAAVNILKANIKSASDLISLPNTVEELQKSVATLGSTLTSVHHDVETLQTEVGEHKKQIETLQDEMAKFAAKDKDQLSTTPSAISSKSQSQTQEIVYLQSSIEDLNVTMLKYQSQNEQKLHSVDSTIANLSQRVNLIENELQFVNKVDNITSPEVVANITKTDPSQVRDESPASKLQENLQLIHALTKQPDAGKIKPEDKSGSGQVTAIPPSLARISPRSLSSGILRPKKEISLPGIFTEKDLEELFRKSEQGIEGKFSFQELEQLLGQLLPEPQNLKRFDADGDNKYSFNELKPALNEK
ncbi:EF-hand calcium-binding domain-containing protein 14 isoform X2 [Bombina bombina]|uniref:EF-hand calcium-binding domain-containing protein 14 isoform X2 n=1 Tax=Bombina bombina TaxID=8345 RepID=UPI00235B2A34|nr:EF-hand calcium-binding domain-containing protein 14 isoform X2 [Bombina bombina]